MYEMVAKWEPCHSKKNQDQEIQALPHTCLSKEYVPDVHAIKAHQPVLPFCAMAIYLIELYIYGLYEMVAKWEPCRRARIGILGKYV